MTTKHTDKKYDEELSKLREEILYMGGLVEDQIQKAIKSLVDRDSDLSSIIQIVAFTQTHHFPLPIHQLSL